VRDEVVRVCYGGGSGGKNWLRWWKWRRERNGYCLSGEVAIDEWVLKKMNSVCSDLVCDDWIYS
jgi:hypothetical protein